MKVFCLSFIMINWGRCLIENTLFPLSIEKGEMNELQDELQVFSLLGLKDFSLQDLNESWTNKLKERLKLYQLPGCSIMR